MPIHSSSSPNYTMSDFLCEELIVEIFTRLPSKSLLRFRSVSKSLRSCIDSPSFIRKHASRSLQRLVIIHQVKYRYIEEYGAAIFCTLHAEDQLPLCPTRGYIGITATAVKFPVKDVYIVAASCYGILCLFDCKKRIISIWNPSIMRQLILPDCPRRSCYGVLVGLGFDPITDDNKIVSIPPVSVETPFVYALKTGAWRPIASPMPEYCSVLSMAYYLNGVLHWMVQHCFTDSKGVAICYIMTLDLSTHVFGMIAVPNPSWDTRQLATIQGSLAMISTKDGDSWIWVRRDASWSVVLKSKTIQVQKGVRKVVELTNNGHLLLDTYCEGLQVYNPKTGARSTLVESNDNFSLIDIEMYVESLHLLDMGTACEVNHLSLQDKKRKRNQPLLSNEH